MENSFYAIEFYSNTRTTSLAYLSIQCYEKRFNITPSYIRLNGVFKDGIENLTLFFVHRLLNLNTYYGTTEWWRFAIWKKGARNHRTPLSN